MHINLTAWLRHYPPKYYLKLNLKLKASHFLSWVSHWMNHSTDSDSLRNKASLYESMTHSSRFKWLIHLVISKREPASQCTQCDISNLHYYLGQIGWIVCTLWWKGLSLWMSHWITDSLDLFKRLIHLNMKQVLLWMSHWITDSLDFV